MISNKIKAFILIAFVLAIATGCEAEEIVNLNQPDKVILAAYEGDTGLLPYIAADQGFFEANGLDVEFKHYEAGKLAADALLAGDADLATSAATVLVSNSFEHPELRVMGTVASADVLGLAARTDKGITVAADVVGKRIGVTKKSHGEYGLGVFLLYNKLHVNDVETLDLTPTDIYEGLVAGTVDGALTWEPNLYNIQRELGDGVVVMKQNMPKLYFVLLGTGRWIDQNPVAATRFMNALVQAEQYVAANEEETKQFMKARFGYTMDYAASTWQKHAFAVELSQGLLLILEDVARWRIQNNLSSGQVPNYLNYIYFDALEEVKPEAVTITH